MRRTKYGAIRTVVDGIRFASKREAKRYGELKLLLQAKKIEHFVVQPKFNLEVKGQHICTYIADFSYYDEEGYIVEDVKGMKTPSYRLKKKLMKACLDIEVREIM